MFDYNRITDSENPLIAELMEHNTNETATYRKQLEEQQPKRAVIICADARHPSASVARDDDFVIEVAGNAFDPSLKLPESIEEIVLIGHEAEKGKGCGACDSAEKYQSDEHFKEEIDPHTSLSRLVSGDMVIPGTRDNIQNAVDKFNSHYVGKTIVGLIYNHVDGKLAFDASHARGEKANAVIADVKKINEEYGKGHASVVNMHLRDGNPFDVRTGQDPYAIVLNLQKPVFYKVFNHDKLGHANAIFEVKVHDDKLIDVAEGSAEYGWLHALGEGVSFKNTDTTILLLHNEKQMREIGSQLEKNKALLGYMARGGQLYSMVPSGEKLSFYRVTNTK